MKILVVDDDTLIRKWMTLLLEQSAKTLEILQAENGADALSLVQENPDLDLIITDIKMPLMNGLELCECVKRLYPSVCIVILSSYDDFSYVKQALRLGATDYILKAEMNAEDIANALQKAQQFKIQHTLSNMPSQGGQLMDKSLLLQEFLAQPNASTQTFLFSLDPQLSPQNLSIFLLKLSFPSSAGISDILQMISLTLNEQGLHAVCLAYTREIIVVFCNNLQQYSHSYDSSSYFGSLSAGIERQAGCRVAAWTAMYIRQATQLQDNLNKALDSLHFKQYYSLNVVDSAQLSDSEPKQFLSMKLLKDISDALSHQQFQEACDALTQYIEESHQLFCAPKEIEKYFTVVGYRLIAACPSVESDTTVFDRLDRLLSACLHLPTKEEFTQAAAAFISYFLKLAVSNRKKLSPSVLSCLQYIDAHYMEKLSLDQLAAHVFLNRTYLSELFKREMGISFNDFLNRQRIIHACEYIQTSHYSMAKIAEMTGFSDQNYFTKIFKKITGQTPRQYKNNQTAGQPQA